MKKYLLTDYKKGIDHSKHTRQKVKDSISVLPNDLYLAIITFIYPKRVDVFSSIESETVASFKKLTALKKYKLRLKAFEVLEEVLND
jgi:hypothetical protein